ncbi:MAG: hypothetical protein LBM75_01195 [Myxococcales bacterium]|nr:hypothetical protein [Myxococcales bacterium]
MKTFKRKSPKAPSKFAQFIRFTMLGACVGFGVMLLKLATFSQLLQYMGGVLSGPLAFVLGQLIEWTDVLLLAPITAYVAGRIFMSNKWKFVFAMFMGIQFLPLSLIYILDDGQGLDLVNVGFRIASIVLGMAISIITFGRGARVALAQEQLPADLSPSAPQPLPQPLSQIDFEAISKQLKETETAAAPEPEEAPRPEVDPERAVPALDQTEGAEQPEQARPAQIDQAS